MRYIIASVNRRSHRGGGVAWLAIVAALVTLVLLTPQKALAETTTVNGLTYEYEVENGGAVITHCSGNIPATLEIPATLDSYKVTSIRGTEYEIEGSEGVPDYYYRSVFYEKYSASHYEKNLKALILPNGLTSVGLAAFTGCNNLQTVSLPPTLTEIEDEAFSLCGLSSVELPSSVTKIGRAFRGCSLTSVKLSEGLTSIKGAFASCSELTDIKIPNSVIEIGDRTFSHCTSLQSVSLGNKVTTIGKYAFSSCTSLTRIDLPDSVTTLGGGAFYQCQSLVNVTLSNNLTCIKAASDPWFCDGAFEGCASLRSISIPNSVIEIGPRAFKGCSLLSNVTLPDSLETLGYSAFAGCRGITAMKIPSSLKRMGSGIFAGCTNLTEVNLPACCTNLGDGEDYAGMFHGCTSLASIVIPASVTTLGDGAFYGCASLISISAPQGITSIGQNSFRNCSSLVSIFVPKSVESIGRNAFDGCTALKSIYYGGTFVTFQLLTVDEGNGAFRNANFHFGTTGLPTQGSSGEQTEGVSQPKSPAKPSTTSPSSNGTSIAKATITVGSKAYTGKRLVPVSVTVKLNGKTLKRGIDYVISCKGGKAVGSYTVTVAGKGSYTGAKTAAFKVVPKAVTGVKTKGTKKSVKVTWKMAPKADRRQMTGYEVRYSAAKSMKAAKAVKVKGTSKNSATIKKLKAGKKYYVQVRAYKVVKGKTYFSTWSKTKMAKVKK